MAAGWDMGFSAMGLAGVAPPPAAAYTYGLPSTDTLRIDDLLGLPSDAHLPFLYYVPSEEAAELEWLSQFVDDSFSDMPYPSSPFIAPSYGGGRGHPMQPHSSSSSANSPTSSSSTTTTTSDFPAASPRQKPTGRRKAARGEEGGGGARRCSHCQSERTPQWRTGPMGPKTLCNACGVRYKSGRLVAEYRPAASPTFVLTQHSNSHRKVMELRRQKDLLLGGIAASAAAGDYEVR